MKKSILALVLISIFLFACSATPPTQKPNPAVVTYEVLPSEAAFLVPASYFSQDRILVKLSGFEQYIQNTASVTFDTTSSKLIIVSWAPFVDIRHIDDPKAICAFTSDNIEVCLDVRVVAEIKSVDGASKFVEAYYYSVAPTNKSGLYRATDLEDITKTEVYEYINTLSKVVLSHMSSVEVINNQNLIFDKVSGSTGNQFIQKGISVKVDFGQFVAIRR